MSICWSHRYVGGLLGAVPIYVSVRRFQQECKIACFHSGATWSSQFVPIFPLSTLLMVSSWVCLHGATPVVDYVCLCFIRWDICKSKVRIHVSLNLFKLMQVCASDQSGFCVLPHKSQGLPLRY